MPRSAIRGDHTNVEFSEVADTSSAAVDFDVIVIGGGPGGSTTAGLLAAAGYRVLVLEREKFPRYHIGESLITGALPVLEKLGLRERLEQLGFTKKYGGTLRWGRSQAPAHGWDVLGGQAEADGAGPTTWHFRFKEASNYEHAYQVRRADFDALLLARARELGAEVVEEVTVREPLLAGDRIVGVSYAGRGESTRQSATCRLLVDASGQAHLLAKHFDLIEWHDDLRNIAVWTYYQGGRRYRGTRAGDILTESRPDGWFWFIPLADQTVSVGYVTPIAAYQRSDLSLEELFATQAAQSEEVSRLLEGARRVSGFRSIRDWSYSCRRFHGPGWVLVGDAAAFIDPLLSTGVTLAVRGAEGAARAIDAALRDPSSAEEVFDRYERNYREFLHTLLEFVRFFYDRSRQKEDYWDKAQEVIDPQRLHSRKKDFATMLSGLTGLSEIFQQPSG